MPERAFDETYSILLDALRSHGLSWVAAQVQDQVRAGKPTTRIVAPRPAPMFDRFAEEITQARPPRRERLAATEPYSAEERVALALDALQRAVIQTADFEEEVAKFFHSAGKTPTRVAFEPEEFEDAQRLEIATLPAPRRNSVERLRQLVNSLRRELPPNANH